MLKSCCAKRKIWFLVWTYWNWRRFLEIFRLVLLLGKWRSDLSPIQTPWKLDTFSLNISHFFPGERLPQLLDLYMFAFDLFTIIESNQWGMFPSSQRKLWSMAARGLTKTALFLARSTTFPRTQHIFWESGKYYQKACRELEKVIGTPPAPAVPTPGKTPIKLQGRLRRLPVFTVMLFFLNGKLEQWGS